MALFGKTSGNKTVYSKQPYVIRGKRKLNEPIYICTGTPNTDVCRPINDLPNSEQTSQRIVDLSINTPHVAKGQYSRKKRKTLYDRKTPSAGFVDEWVYNMDENNVEDTLFFEGINGRGDNDNDIISLNFYLPAYGKRDQFGRTLFTAFCVYIDAADYEKLDVQEFVNRIDREIKENKDPRFLLTYPIIWDLPRIQKQIERVHDWDEMVKYMGTKSVEDFPQTIPYDKAIRTKDGRPVIGSVLTNPTLKDIKATKPAAPKQTKTAATPTQPTPVKKAVTPVIPTPSSLNMVYDPTTGTWVKKDAVKAQPQPTPTPAKTQQPATEKVAKSKNDVVIRALTNELTGIRQQIKDLQDEAEALESQIKKLQGENTDSSTLGRK